ncbi:hypothetical protein IMCC9480_1871 [Oxalobacteraceae bacterium IMCC9480]|nr:hypothetical protein IMCC9480_1871 [Oxalobacteraceae bacterium IMCC9480]
MLVFDDQDQLVAGDAALGIDFVSGQRQAILDGAAVFGGRAGQCFGGTELDVGGEGGTADTGSDQGQGKFLDGQCGVHGGSGKWRVSDVVGHCFMAGSVSVFL